MERYEYARATTAFRQVHREAPDWIPGSINLAIALLNDAGTQAEARGGPGHFDEALSLLNDVLSRDPNNLHAHYLRGLINESLGQEKTAAANLDFRFVADHDPSDGHAWYKVGSTLNAPGPTYLPAGPAQAEELIALYRRALECNPALVPALYKLQQAYGWAKQPEKQAETLDRWRALNPRIDPAGPGDTAEGAYGENGRYARLIDPFPNPREPAPAVPAPRFDSPSAIQVSLAEGENWVGADDFYGADAPLGRARARFGATLASFDANGDGRLDLYLAAAVKRPDGTIRDALLLNRGDGVFDDVSRPWGIAEVPASLGVAAGDFDADRRIDLFLTGLVGYRLLHNVADKSFEDVTAKAGLGNPHALGLTARWLDLDQDGDLDLYVINHTDLAHAARAFKGDVPGVSNIAFRNIGKAVAVSSRAGPNWTPPAVSTSDRTEGSGLSIAFEPWPDSDALTGPPARSTGIAALDLDDDRDLDLIVSAEGSVPRAILNDRLGKFHAVSLPALGPSILGLLVVDLDKDGRADLAALTADQGVVAWRNASKDKVTWERWPVNAGTWRTAYALDLDLDTWPDLVGLPSGELPLIDWARNDSRRLSKRPMLALATRPAGVALADLVGDPLPDCLVLNENSPPVLARNLGNGQHWLGLDLGGRWKTGFDHMRTNPQGLGTRINLEGQGLHVTHDQTTPAASLGQSVGPVVLGLGKSESVDLVRLRWPDGTMQCELNQKADVVVTIAETNRKTGSCPVLFTWNGSRFVCVGDFLGGGGLGYLVAPGVYSQPDRDESVAISPDQLQPVEGMFRLAITEPMDEVSYLDTLDLVVVDRPPGVIAALDERLAPDGPRPSGQVIAWKTVIAPARATDLNGRDVTEILRDRDRKTVDGFKRLGWVGYAEEHGIVLDFADRLGSIKGSDPVVLALAGWVEYPYSQTNYAASTAGISLRAPMVERQNDDGSWSIIEPHAGYPAGLPRLMTLDLTGKLVGAQCTIRLRTNMECYWDQAFVALRDPQAEAAIRQTILPVARASLGQRGYSREVSPDGLEPLLYDYDHTDPAPLASMAGRLTPHGDVQSLLLADDDRFCLVGPGEEVRLEFSAGNLPDLPAGWSRSYVLKAVGYCKDADPFTATSDRIEPLPWRTMPAFPFSKE